MEYSHLDENTRGLVKFHRDGFGVDDEGYINDYFIDEVLRGQESISKVVMHFAMTLFGAIITVFVRAIGIIAFVFFAGSYWSDGHVVNTSVLLD